VSDAIKDIINSPGVRRAFTDLVFGAIETLLARVERDDDVDNSDEKKED
jgi:hypothetical protein